MELYDQDAKRCCEYLQHMCCQTDEDAFLLICMRFFFHILQIYLKFIFKYRNIINWYNVNIPTYWSTEICFVPL